jgi:hypothetical protein
MVDGASARASSVPLPSTLLEETIDEEAMRVSKETWIVATLCAVDLLSTLLLVQRQGADEGNSLMSFYLQQGTGNFIAAKCLMFIPALLIAEWYRRRNPRLVSTTLRGVIVMYLVFYAVGVFQVNRPVTAAALRDEYTPPRPAPVLALPLHPIRVGSRAAGM